MYRAIVTRGSIARPPNLSPPAGEAGHLGVLTRISERIER